MNHCVPDFRDIEEDNYSTPTPNSAAGFNSRPKKSPTGEGGEDIMELLWQNGQVVVHSQNQLKPWKKNTFSGGGSEVVIPSDRSEIRSSNEEQQQQHLFMQEDEMASWLQYSLDESSFDRDLYADLLDSAPPPVTAVAEIRPLPPPNRPVANAKPPQGSSRVQNFGHFSRIPGRPRAPVATMRESTVVESNETPLVRMESRISHTAPPRVNAECSGGAAAATSGKLTGGTCDLTVTSSPGGSFSASGEAHTPKQRRTTVVQDRKRKAQVEADDNNECQSEDIEFEATQTKKQSRGSTSTKRSRAAEVHNLSERRRRDRINEKMKALQELIPRCNKSDKASMLDEAIEYLKSLQMQVQMMSMGCGMVPMMYPGMQQYMPAMGMSMGMGMGMDMGMNRPMVPYPPMVPSSTMPNPAHMGPRFPMPAFHMPPLDPSRVQAPNQADHHMLNSGVAHNPNQPQVPNFVDPYHQFLGLHQGHLPLQQNQAMAQHGANKASTSKDMGNPENR